jgi:hypothetical protein
LLPLYRSEMSPWVVPPPAGPPRCRLGASCSARRSAVLRPGRLGAWRPAVAGGGLEAPGAAAWSGGRRPSRLELEAQLPGCVPAWSCWRPGGTGRQTRGATTWKPGALEARRRRVQTCSQGVEQIDEQSRRPPPPSAGCEWGLGLGLDRLVRGCSTEEK